MGLRAKRTNNVLREDIRYMRRELSKYHPGIADKLDEVYGLAASALTSDQAQRRELEQQLIQQSI